MQTVLNIYKPQYYTPLQIIDALREKYPEYKDIPITYAGRLDPLADGVLLLLTGEEAKNRARYLELPKTYEFAVLFGISTDTYDTLGIIQTIKHTFDYEKIQKITERFVVSKTGKHIQQYPPYSSKTVNGKPLFWWAKNNRLSEIIIPDREIEIFTFEIIKSGSVTSTQLLKYIYEQTENISGDFRQNAILKNWEEECNDKKNTFPVMKFRITCSSGTYVRGLAHELGTITELGAITMGIHRTAVGNYTLDSSLKLALRFNPFPFEV